MVSILSKEVFGILLILDAKSAVKARHLARIEIMSWRERAWWPYILLRTSRVVTISC